MIRGRRCLAMHVFTFVVAGAVAVQMMLAMGKSMGAKLTPMNAADQQKRVPQEEADVSAMADVNQNDVGWFVQVRLESQYDEDAELKLAHPQVSDLHISQFRGRPERSGEFISFCRFVDASVRPLATLVSGDMVDAKGEMVLFGSSSMQYLSEWEEYKMAMDECRKMRVGHWLDVRGNHDVFDVSSEESPTNMFARYSGQGGQHKRSYLKTVANDMGYNFDLLAVDSTPKPGLRRLFNFFGVITTQDSRELKDLLRQARPAQHGSRYRPIVAFGHYPTGSTNAATGQTLSEILPAGGAPVYMCGHYHTGYGHFERLYSRHRTGLLELELGDWKDYRKFRIFALDQGYFSFADASYNVSRKDNAVVVVTNPKAAEFLTGYESLQAIRQSRTVRALAFAEGGVKRVSLILPDGSAPRPMRQTGAGADHNWPVYEAEWKPESFIEGRHRLVIRLETADGTSRDFEHFFALDGNQNEYQLNARVILLTDWLSISATVFSFTSFAVIFWMTAARLYHHFAASRILSSASRGRGERLTATRSRVYEEDGQHRGIVAGILSCPWHLCQYFLRRITLLASSDLYLPLVTSVLYVCILPWCVSEVLEGRLAVISAWGIVILSDFTYSPPDLTFAVGFIHYATFLGPSIWVLSGEVERAYRQACAGRTIPDENAQHGRIESTGGLVRRCFSLAWRHLGMIFILSLALHNCLVLMWMYGLVSVLSPWGVGRVLFFLHLYARARKMRKTDFDAVGDIWRESSKRSLR